MSYSFKNLLSNATTLVKSGAGFLHAVTINSNGASSNTITLYDGLDANGVKIGTIDGTAAEVTLEYDVNFKTGLCVVIATGTAADITVSYN